MHKRGQNTRVSRGERGTEGGEEGGGGEEVQGLMQNGKQEGRT